MLNSQPIDFQYKRDRSPRPHTIDEKYAEVDEKSGKVKRIKFENMKYDRSKFYKD